MLSLAIIMLSLMNLPMLTEALEQKVHWLNYLADLANS